MVRPVRPAALALLLLSLAGCSSATENTTGAAAQAPPQTQTPETQAPETQATESDSRCLPVPKALVRGIEEGLTVEGGGTLRNAKAVKSEDFKNVYYVSADIQGPGLEGDDDIGTWATNSLKVGEGLIIGADEVAREFSDWGAAASPDSPAGQVIGLQNDGAEESRDCVNQ